MAAEIKLIVGLGNPGKNYQNTRHNLGFSVVSQLARQHGLRFKKELFSKSFVAQGDMEGQAVKLALPLTYMNKCGWAVKRLVAKSKIELKNLLVVCDDINLKLGRMRIRPAGSDGGHNGLKSIIASLGNQDFHRLRLGIAQEQKPEDVAEFVLRGFDRGEKSLVISQIARAVDCCDHWIREGIVKTMDKFNKGKGYGKI